MPINTTTLNDVVVHVFPDIPTYTTNKSQVGTNDLIQVDPESLQDKLVSGTNIKTINGESILGTGNITVEGGETGGVEHRLTIGDPIEMYSPNLPTARFFEILDSGTDIMSWITNGDTFVIPAGLVSFKDIKIKTEPLLGLPLCVDIMWYLRAIVTTYAIAPKNQVFEYDEDTDDTSFCLAVIMDIVDNTITSDFSNIDRRSYTEIDLTDAPWSLTPRHFEINIAYTYDKYILFKNKTGNDVIVNTLFGGFHLTIPGDTYDDNPTVIMPKEPVTLPAGCAVEASYINPPGTNDVVVTFSDILTLPE